MEFFNNKVNDKLKFKLNAEGINTNDVEARLVFNSKDKMNCIIFGKITEGICSFDVPELKIYESNDSGNIRFELVSKDLYFNVWEDKFTIKTKTSIKLNEMIRETVEEEKPKISVSLEATPILEKNEEEKEPEIIKEKKESKPIKSFDTFLKK